MTKEQHGQGMSDADFDALFREWGAPPPLPVMVKGKPRAVAPHIELASDLDTDQVFDLLKQFGTLAYIVRAMQRFPGKRGFVDLMALTKAINRREFLPPC